MLAHTNAWVNIDTSIIEGNAVGFHFNAEAGLPSDAWFQDNIFRDNAAAVLLERVPNGIPLEFPGSQFEGSGQDIDNRIFGSKRPWVRIPALRIFILPAKPGSPLSSRAFPHTFPVGQCSPAPCNDPAHCGKYYAVNDGLGGPVWAGAVCRMKYPEFGNQPDFPAI